MKAEDKFVRRRMVAGYHPTDGNEWPDGERLTNEWGLLRDERQLWGELASPLIQFVQALDLAAILLRESIHLDSAVLGLSGLASQTGPVADLVRTQLVAAGRGCAVEVLGGMPVSSLIAAAWKQSMLDNLLAWYALTVVWPERMPTGLSGSVSIDEEELDEAAPGLFELVCPMSTASRRAEVRTAMGTLRAEVAAGTIVGVRSGGSVAELLSGLSTGGFCASWDALAPAQQGLAGVLSRLAACPPEFFDPAFKDDKRLGVPSEMAGLREHSRADLAELNTPSSATLPR